MHILLNLAKVYTHTAKLVNHISLALSMLGRLCYFGVPSGGLTLSFSHHWMIPQATRSTKIEVN